MTRLIDAAPKDIVFCYLCKWSESDHGYEDGYYCHHDTHNPKWKVFSHCFCSWGELAEEYKDYTHAPTTDLISRADAIEEGGKLCV